MAKIVAPKSIKEEETTQVVNNEQNVEESTNTEMPTETPVKSTETKVENTEKPTKWTSEAMQAIL